MDPDLTVFNGQTLSGLGTATAASWPLKPQRPQETFAKRNILQCVGHAVLPWILLRPPHTSSRAHGLSLALMAWEIASARPTHIDEYYDMKYETLIYVKRFRISHQT